MSDRIDSIVEWLIDRTYEFYIYILEIYLALRPFDHNINYYLSSSEMKDFMEYSFVDEMLDSEITKIVQDNLNSEISSFFNDWGFNLSERKGRFGIWKTGPIEAFLFEFIIEHYKSVITGEEDQFLRLYKQRLTIKSVTINHKIYLNSPLCVPLNIQLSKQDSDRLNIKLVCFHPLRVYPPIVKKDLSTDSLEDFLELPEPDIQSVFFLPPPYARRSQFRDKIPVTFHPNTLLLIDQSLMIREFHENCEKLHLRQRPNVYTTALDIGFVFVTLFNLLHLPSDVLEYRVSPVDIGTFEIPDETLLYPEKIKKGENPLIKKPSLANVWGNHYYNTQIHPLKVDYAILNELWLKYSNILLNRERFPHLDMACRRLYRSFKTPDPEDILLELIIGLESLFSIKGKSHKSFYTSIMNLTPTEKRGETRAFAKALYNIRSRIVHGDNFNKDLERVFQDFTTVSDFMDLIFETRKFLILGIIDYITLFKIYKNKKKVVDFLILQDQKELSEELRANYDWVKKSRKAKIR